MNDQSGETRIFLANTDKRSNQREAYVYRWLTSTGSLVVERNAISYEKCDRAIIRLLDLYPLQTVPFSHVQITLVPLNMSKPSFQSTPKPCPTTNCNETYVYRPNNPRLLELLVDDINLLQLNFMVDSNPSAPIVPVLVEFESLTLFDLS